MPANLLPAEQTSYRCRCGLTVAFNHHEPHEAQAARQGVSLTDGVLYCTPKCAEGRRLDGPQHARFVQLRCAVCERVFSWEPPTSVSRTHDPRWTCCADCARALPGGAQ
jgi:hypothetical protein